MNRALSGMLVAVALAACRDPLTVKNWNNPDRLRVLARPSDLEALVGGTFKTAFNGTYGSNGLAPSARTMSWESASNLNNWGMGPRSAIPRVFIDNAKGNAYQAENNTDHMALARAARAAADGINRLTPTLGAISLGSVAQDARAKAWAWFALAYATGMLAMDYDSMAIVWPYDDLAFVAPLTGHAEGAVAALNELDSAVAWATTAQSAAGANNFPIPADWFWNNTAIDAPTFIRICRTYKAYFRANVARTPTERAAVGWTAVRDDAAAGLTTPATDISVTTGGGKGWNIAQNQVYTRSGWGQLSLLIGGMADSTGAQFDAWLATPMGSKVPFLVRTVDRRFPQGDTRPAQQTATGAVPAGACARCYFANRLADTPSDPWTSYYEWYRTQAWFNTSNGTGPTPVLVTPMTDLLQAEARIRLGDIAGAAALIDRTRTPNSLPALTGAWAATATLTTPVPGGSACVPRVPVGASQTPSACGNIMEAMKWEYRLETMYVSYIAQFHSGRGWGDFAEGTAVDWPLPWQELDARRYTTFPNRGGTNLLGGTVGKGTYGY